MDTTTRPVGEVACCGLYCGACRSHLKGRCGGCRAKLSATWCAVRTCCIEHGRRTCAECAEFPDPRECPKFDNWVSRTLGVLFNSDRPACIDRIRAAGVEGFALDMHAQGRLTIRRR